MIEVDKSRNGDYTERLESGIERDMSSLEENDELGTNRNGLEVDISEEKYYNHRLWEEWIPLYGGFLVGNRHHGDHGQRDESTISREEMTDIRFRTNYHYVVDPLAAGSVLILPFLFQ